MFYRTQWFALLVFSLALAATASAQAPDDADATAATRPQLLIPPYAQGRIMQLAFLADSRTLITQDEQTITLWDTEKGLMLDALPGGSGAPNPLFGMRLLPDRKHFWMNSHMNATAQKRDVENLHASFRSVPLVANIHRNFMMADAIESTLLYRDRNNGAVVLTPQTDKAEWQQLPSKKGWTDAAKFHPSGGTVAIGNYDGHLTLYDYAGKRTVYDVAIPDAAITQVAFSPDGNLLATVAHPTGCFDANANDINYFVHFTGNNKCSGKPIITIRTAADGKEVYSSPFDQAYVVAFSPDSRVLAVGTQTRIQLINIERKSVVRDVVLAREVAKHYAGPTDVRLAFSPDNRLIAQTSLRSINIIDIAAGRELRTLADPPVVWLSNSRLTDTGHLIGAVNRPGRIVVTEYSPGVSTRVLRADSGPTGRPIFSSDGRTLVSESNDRAIRVWNIDQPQPVCKIPMSYRPWTAWADKDVSSDGSFLVIPASEREGAEQGVELWNTRSCQKLATVVSELNPELVLPFAFAAREPANREKNLLRVAVVAVSPGGRYLGWATVGNMFYVWDRSERRFVISARLPVPAVYSERDAATGKITNHVKIGDQSSPVPQADASAQEWLRFEQLAGGIGGINFSPDESNVGVLDYNGVTRLLSTHTGKPLFTLGSVPPGDTVLIIANSFPTTFNGGTLAFSPDGISGVVSFGARNQPVLWDLTRGKVIRTIQGTRTNSSSAHLTPDGKTLVMDGGGGYIVIADAASGERLARLGAYGDGMDWEVSLDDGLFDGTASAYQQLAWTFPGTNQSPLPLEAFFSDFFRPGLLADLLAGQRPHATKDLAKVDRRQARIEIENTQPAQQPGSNAPPKNAVLRIRIFPPTPDDRNDVAGAVRDLRLFRNGSMVRSWHGVLKPNGRGFVELTASVPLVAGPNQLTAYSFNQDNVQSATGLLYVDGARSLARKGTAYVIVAAVNEYENPQFNLRYAVPDAQLVARTFSANLESTHRYGRVNVISLLDAEATKSNLLNVLVRLSGGSIGSIPEGAAPARPEDSVFIFFAGHGVASEGSFYLIPHDLGYKGPRGRLAADKAAMQMILSHGISDRELAAIVENIDAAQIALVIDSCNSGQLLESEETRHGPFNSKGLAQLAWDKGIFVLTASQSYQAAMEASQLEHGYLTYALMEEGLNQRKADWDPEDGQVDIKEWFSYASARVPEMQRERAAQARLLVQPKDSHGERPTDVQTPRAFSRSDFNNYFLVSGLPPAKHVDCAQEASLRPKDSRFPVVMEFQNTASTIRKIFFLDFSGNRAPYQTLAPGAVYRIGSYRSHPWIVTDATDTCLGIYLPADQGGLALVQ